MIDILIFYWIFSSIVISVYMWESESSIGMPISLGRVIRWIILSGIYLPALIGQTLAKIEKWKI